MFLDSRHVRLAVLGGAFLGGGGGGRAKNGAALGQLALEVGQPLLVPLSDIAPGDLIATVSVVGAPAAREQSVKPADYAHALELLQERIHGRIAGIISSENGGQSTLNGWFQSALTGVPVVDAACDGRAHPTGVMGSMGLDAVEGFISTQAVIGGNPAAGRRVRTVVEGSLPAVDRLVRQAAVEAGGLVAVARNPVTAAYVQENGVPGAIGLAIELGGVIEDAMPGGGPAVAAALAQRLNGEVLGEGEVSDFRIETTGGYDVGRLAFGDLRLTFWNEYMTADQGNKRRATFPDLIATLDAETGLAVSSADVVNGQRLVVVSVPKARLLLGAGVRRAEALRPVEAVLGESLVAYF